jgi:hypothetical protein
MSRQEALKAFSEKYPTYTILGAETGEGWDGVVTYHFAFRKPGNEDVFRENWTFEVQPDGNWRVTGRWTPRH